MGSQDATATARVLHELAVNREYPGPGVQNVALSIWSNTQKLTAEQRTALFDAIARRSSRLNEYVTALIAA